MDRRRKLYSKDCLIVSGIDTLSHNNKANNGGVTIDR